MKRLHKIVKETVRSQANVLYIGCKNAAILHALNPKYGVGVETNKKLVRRAKQKYPHLTILSTRITEIKPKKKFDYIILDDILPYLSDMFQTFQFLRRICKDDGKIIMSSLPEMKTIRSILNPLQSTKKIKNWIPHQLMVNQLYTANFWPRPVKEGCIIADAVLQKQQTKYSYSIIIPAYNEEGNIKECIERIPKMNRDIEIIVVNDGSTDNTSKVVRDCMKKNKKIVFVDYKKNRGKGYATKRGLDAATKDVLMILDADMTVKPEDLPLFMEPLELRNAEFVNGTRMVYPMADQAMKTLNIVGNKMFSMIFSYLLDQKVTDTLCGTKCMFRQDYQRMVMKDNAWPDFDLLFGAARINLKIVEVPIHYQNRVSGESKMHAFKHGWMLLKASFKGFIELKIKR